LNNHTKQKKRFERNGIVTLDKESKANGIYQTKSGKTKNFKPHRLPMIQHEQLLRRYLKEVAKEASL